MGRLTLAGLAAAAMLATTAARAQTFDPNYPVCLHVYGPLTYYECSYTSLPQCNLSASGRAAQCEVNPYFANAHMVRPWPSHRRRHHRAY